MDEEMMLSQLRATNSTSSNKCKDPNPDDPSSLRLGLGASLSELRPHKTLRQATALISPPWPIRRGRKWRQTNWGITSVLGLRFQLRA